MWHLPPILFAAAAKAVGEWLNKSSQSTPSANLRGPRHYYHYAVQPHDIEMFLRTHPDAMHIRDYLDSLRARGQFDDADNASLSALRLLSEHPGCVMFVADFRPA